jgi:hypothetical protein
VVGQLWFIKIATVFRHEHSASIRDFVCCSVDWSVHWLVRLSPFTLNVIFSAVCGPIDLKFGRDLHVDLFFQFSSYSFFFLVPPLTPPCPSLPFPQKLNFFTIRWQMVTLERMTFDVNGCPRLWLHQRALILKGSTPQGVNSSRSKGQ